MQTRILVIGAKGQLGTVLTVALQKKYTLEHVIASDINEDKVYEGIFEALDATNKEQLTAVVQQYRITQIYHLAAVLSAKGEENPLFTWQLNMQTLFNVLEVAREQRIEKVFFPSSIAVFGAAAPLINTPVDAYLNPATVYGISKAAGENWAQYYYLRYGVDVRSIRYPGIIGYQSLPGGGTTDYAVDIYHKAVLEEAFTCFLKSDQALPMLFMEDAVRAAIELMEAPKEQLTIRTAYNIAGISIAPKDIEASIRKEYPSFHVAYAPDFRQEIAAKWPSSIDDSVAAHDWGWQSSYTLDTMTKVMIEKLRAYYQLDVAG